MNYYSMPADFRKETIDAYDRLNSSYKDSRIIETYGQVTLEANFESGRNSRVIPQIDLIGLREYIDYAKARNIEFNYTFNAPYMHNIEFTSDGVARIKSYLYDLHWAGVRTLTIAMPSLMELVQSSGLDFTIKASTICQITNANKAIFFKNRGIDRIVLDESVNRDFQTLKRVRDAFGEKVEIIVNSLCHKECTYRMFHYLQTCGTYRQELEKSACNYFGHRCSLKVLEDLALLAKLCWVRPEDVKYYNQIGIQYFKLQGREYILTGDPVKAVEYYFKGDYDGNLMALLDLFTTRLAFKFYLDNKKLEGFIKPFVENDNFCKRDCPSCRYCDSFVAKAIDLEKAREMTKLAEKFYEEIDEYGRFVKNTDSLKKEPQECNTDFDFNAG